MSDEEEVRLQRCKVHGKQKDRVQDLNVKVLICFTCGVEGHKQGDPECQGKSAPGLECHMGGKCGEMGHRIQWECPKKE